MSSQENFRRSFRTYRKSAKNLADYMGEVMAFDAAIGVHLEELENAGLTSNTLIMISGDHGPPGFPHGKCNLYEFGTGVSLAISGPGMTGGRVVDDFVNCRIWHQRFWKPLDCSRLM